ncbi:hypothetical protein ANANG_G00038210 [Anguilla anguilla]|uniref:Uncharacterized protein n=1 Tax=Anguilla anguilla TaxID=7936 RepID=A0A9D3S935_ANGAN|nr:hypothetical protein ANANG_G00038210 [Anguilla anguilla]
MATILGLVLARGQRRKWSYQSIALTFSSCGTELRRRREGALLPASIFALLHFIFTRELEAIATKEAEEKQNRDIVQEKEEQLMEERKKRKDEKKKKEAGLKKASEQKNKVPEHIKSSLSQPQPANPKSDASTVTSIVSNAKRAQASSHPQVPPRYPPREVPPRFRQHEQKQLLKRGQPLPIPAATLGSRAPLTTAQPGGAVLACEAPFQNSTNSNLPGMPPIRDLASHSPNQTGDYDFYFHPILWLGFPSAV